MSRTPLALAIACAGVAAAAQAAAPPMTQHVADGALAAVSYFQLNANDCERLSIDAAARLERGAAAPAQVTLMLLSENSCSGETARFSGSGPTAQFEIDPERGSAALRARVVVADTAGRQRTLDVDLRWSGGAPMPRAAEAVPFSMPDARATFSRFDSVRAGSVVGGVLRLDGIDLLAAGSAPEMALIGGALARGRDAQYAVAPVR